MAETGADSNSETVNRLLDRLCSTFDLTQPGTVEESFGRDLLSATAVMITSRTLGDQMEPDFSPLAPNRGGYAVEKAKRGLPVGVGLDAQSNDRMLSLPQVQGEQTITPDTATMRYGVTDAARRKAEWFTAGSNDGLGIEPSEAANQPERPFYALDEVTEGELVVMCDELIERTLAEIASEFGG